MIAIVIGSENDRGIIRNSGMQNILNECGVKWELSIISAHRHPKTLSAYCQEAKSRGVKVFIATAGMSAQLAGVIAANTETLPVIGVPLPSREFPNAMDALLSMVRMPAGCPVAVPGIGESGLRNAAILAAQIMSLENKNAQTAGDKLSSFFRVDKKPAEVCFEKSQLKEGC